MESRPRVWDGSEPDQARLAESVPELVQRLRSEIERRGAIPFADFMAAALYDPQFGYYRVAVRRPGRGGDFLTAPEATPLFGITLARQVAECWERLGSPDHFVIREYGAGIGGLAYDVLAGLSEASPGAFAAAEYRLADVNAERLADALAAMAQVGLAEKVEAELVEEGESLEPITGVVLANEVADALPAHRLIWRNGAPLELWVGWCDGWFCDVEGPISPPAQPAVEQVTGVVTFREGDRFDVAPAAAAWFHAAGQALERGFAIIIDYGYPAGELYAEQRRTGLVRGYAGHTVTDDPYLRIGAQDLTTHVDFTALERAGREAGLESAGLTTQADFLAALGLGEQLVALQRDPDMTVEQYLAAQAAVLRLIDPGGLGRFRVLAMAKSAPVDPPLRGFRTLSGLF